MCKKDYADIPALTKAAQVPEPADRKVGFLVVVPVGEINISDENWPRYRSGIRMGTMDPEFADNLPDWIRDQILDKAWAVLADRGSRGIKIELD